MLNLVNAAKGVPLQILNIFSIEKKLEHLINQGHNSEKVTKFYECRNSNNPLKNCRTIGSGINMLDKEKVSRTFNKTEVQAYFAAIGAVPQVVSEYSRMIMNSRMYLSEAYRRAEKHIIL
ncbi:hypothetical protein AVEN_206310-1 [Araneus ventricosus]|uniref:Uncharacterized protein n=1 Tax=Araneus ventricosus TaxID=182803 RepID=A0A4Y2VLC2_ARAVE|nr:hypothetical protein AVEN_206310-1 [Araneus ventricosus]